jgi:hypothetical protein
MHRLALAGVLLSIGTARADRAALDAALCLRDDPNRGHFVSVSAPAPTSSVTMTEDGAVTACRGQTCTKLVVKGFVPQQVEGGPRDIAIDPDATRLLVGGNTDSKAMRVVRVKDGSLAAKIVNKRHREYSCGAGMWLGDYVLAFGEDCEEYDSQPFLANAVTGHYVAAFAGVAATAGAMYAAVRLDGHAWAIAVTDREGPGAGLARGKVVAIDVTNGKVLATADGTEAGGAVVTEGKQTRTLDKLAACP